MKEEFQKSGFNDAVTAAVTDAVAIDIPKRKSIYTGEYHVSVNWRKYLLKYWLPALTLLGYILENNLGVKASIILAIKTIIAYSWGGSSDMRAPRKEDESL